MSWYRVQEFDILRVGQLFLQQDITSTYPSAGTVLYTDGVGGTFWSTAGAGGGGGSGTVTDAVLTSTIVGLGNLSYVSSTQLQSTVQGLGNFYTSTAASGILGYQLISTVDGLGLAGYASTSYVGFQISSFSTSIAAAIGSGGGISQANLTSTFVGLATGGYISSTQLFSSVSGMTSASASQFTSTTAGLGTAGYASTSYVLFQLSSFSTALGAVGAGNLTTANLTSTTAGLGTAGYLSTLTNVVSTPFLNTALASTTQGLGTAGYISSFANIISTSYLNTALASTTQGLGTAGYLSTLTNVVSTASLNTALASTTAGLGTAGYASTSYVIAQISSFSTSLGSVGAGNLTTVNLTSTVAGLGTAGYVSTLLNLVSTPFLNSTLASTLSGLAIQQTISSLTVNQLLVGSGTGWIQFGPIQASIVSTIQENVQSNYTNNLFLGTVSAATAAKFYGLTGSYSNTVLAEISTGAGTQEFLIFKGSSVNDKVRVQTTGGFVVETGVSARTWNDNTGNTLPLAIPSFIVTSSSNVGIQTANPATALDVAGTIRAPNLSTQALVISSINGMVFGAPVSTVALFTSNTSNFFQNLTLYNGSTALISTTQGLGTAGYLSTLVNVVSTPYLNTVLASTTQGLGTAGYLSTLVNVVSTPYLNTVLASTTQGLGTAGYLSTLVNVVSTPYLNTVLASTTQGLGTAGYASTSYVNQQISSFSTSLGAIGSGNLTTQNLASTVAGLGTAGYISSTQLFSTTTGLEQFVSTSIQAIPFVYAGATLYLNYSIPSGTYRALESVILSTSQQLVTTPLTGNTSNVFVAGFQSDFTLPVNIPAGVWNMALFCQASGTNVYAYIDLYLRNSGGIETLVASLASVPKLVSQTFGQLFFALPLIATPIPTGNVLVLKVFANNAGSPSRSINTYYQDSTYSYIQTTFGTIIDNTVLASTIVGLGSFGYISTLQLASTVVGLGTAGYASTSYVTAQISSFSTSLGAIGSGNLTTQNLASTVAGLGTAGYLSTLLDLVSTPFLNRTLASTTQGLGTAGYASTSFVGQQISTFSTSISAAIGGSVGVTQTVLNSTFAGLATGGYISSSQLFSTVAGIGTGGGTGGGITTAQLVSTTDGLGTIQYASTQRFYISTVSTLAISWPPINVPTVLIQDWSTAVSSVALFTSNTSNYYSNTVINTSTPLFSTVAGLGTASYASTQWVYIPNISTQAVLPFPSINNPPLSTVSASFGTFSTLTGLDTYTNALTFSNQTQVSGTGSQGIFMSAGGGVGINCNAPAYTLDVSGTANISGNLTSRVRIIGSTLTTSQTIQVSDIASFFFYTVSTPGISITMPSVSAAGTGWTVTIQNTPNSVQTLNILTTPNVILSQNQTVRIFSDGSSWYFI